MLSTNDLRALGATVEVAVCAIDRQEGGAEALDGSLAHHRVGVQQQQVAATGASRKEVVRPREAQVALPLREGHLREAFSDELRGSVS